MTLYPNPAPRPRARLLDETEHYPLPAFSKRKWHGTGLTLACTHADCMWVLDRNIVEGESIAELYALYHPHPIVVDDIWTPTVVAVHRQTTELVDALIEKAEQVIDDGGVV